VGANRSALRLRAVAKAVERDSHDVFHLIGVVGGHPRDAGQHLEYVRELDVRPYDPDVLGALEQRFAGGVDGTPTFLEEGRVLVQVLQEFLGERPLRGQIADQPLAPAAEGLPRVVVGLRSGATDLVDLFDVKSLEQSLPARKVTVERADSDVRLAGDLLERGRFAALRKRLARGREDSLVVAPRVGPLRAGRRWIGGDLC
jgi:hypothetical protein